MTTGETPAPAMPAPEGPAEEIPAVQMPVGPPPRRFAERYVEIVNRGAYGELGDLFAEDAVWLGPNRQELAGRPAIGAFYERFLGEITPQIRIARYVEAGDECVYELEARTVGEAAFTLGAIDHATLGPDGRVTRFSVFTK
jgi:ketosteroid isomerase-like protein